MYTSTKEDLTMLESLIVATNGLAHALCFSAFTLYLSDNIVARRWIRRSLVLIVVASFCSIFLDVFLSILLSSKALIGISGSIGIIFFILYLACKLLQRFIRKHEMLSMCLQLIACLAILFYLGMSIYGLSMLFNCLSGSLPTGFFYFLIPIIAAFLPALSFSAR